MEVKSLILIRLAIILILITHVNVTLLLLIILILTSDVNVNVKASGVWSPDDSHLSCRLTCLHSSSQYLLQKITFSKRDFQKRSNQHLLL